MHFRRLSKIAVVTLGAAVTVGLGSGVAMADRANGDLPVCQVEPNSDGCSTSPMPTPGGPAPWVADQFQYDGTNLLGMDFYLRKDGKAATAYQAAILQSNLGYTNPCWVPWWSTSNVICPP